MSLEVQLPGLYIDGQWRQPADRLPVRHKYSGAILSEVGLAGPADVQSAVAAARRALAQPLSPFDRSAILLRAAAGLKERAEELALLIAREAGKPLKDARAEVERGAQVFILSAEEAKRLTGELLPINASPGNEERIAFTMRVPVGVVAAITPFNFPLNLVAHKVAPALAAGNAVVLKPSELTPLTAIELCRILAEAGLPPGYLNLVIGMGGTVGEALLSEPGVDLYTFTGSARVGRHIKEKTGLRRVVLELGNNSPNIVCADADLDRAAAVLARRAYGSAGQFCISVQRIYVEDAVADALCERLLAETAKLVVGDPEDERTDVGPMISEEAASRAESWVQEALAGGARLLCGGGRRGAMLDPVLLDNVQRDMKVVCEEVFAPVASLIRVPSFAAAVAAANDSRFGLQAAVFTRDLGQAMAAVRQLEFGSVIINDASGFRADMMPYGGVKESGIGREGPRYAIEDMTDVRVAVIQA